jgi:hypothetical protein
MQMLLAVHLIFPEGKKMPVSFRLRIIRALCLS